MLCLMMSHSSWPQHNQSCGFCDAHRLYPTSLYTLTGCSDGHAEGKSGDEMFQYHTHTQAIPIWCFCASEDGIPKICKHMKSTQKSNLSACSLSHPAVCTCLDRRLVVHKSQHGLLCLCLPRNFH